MKGVVKSISEVLKSHRLSLLKSLLSLQIAFFVFLFFQSVEGDHYFLAYEDEVINFCSAKVFSETGSVRAEGCIEENVSRIGEMNWYGPGYSIIYGVAKNIFGDSNSLFIKIHFMLTLFAILVIFFLPVSLEDRLLSCSAIMFTEQFTGYVFTYFPEPIHLLMSVVFILLLLRIYQSKEHKLISRYVVIFISLVLITALTRVTAIFWLTCLIGLSDSKKTTIRMMMVFIVGLIATLLFMRYFTAPPYAADMQKIDSLYRFDILGFIYKTVGATARNTFALIQSGSIAVYVLLLLMFITVIRWWQTKDRLLLAALFVSISLVGALMAYYSAGSWYFLKQSAILIPLLIISLIVTSPNLKFSYLILLASSMLFPLLYKNINTSIIERKNAYDVLQTEKSFQLALQEITGFIDDKSEVTILWCYNEFAYGSAAEALMPFSTLHGDPILYSTNIVQLADNDEVRFKLHNKLKVGYILSRNPLSLPSIKLLHQNEFYSFYKVME